MTLKILAIETATEACSAALLVNDEDANKDANDQIFSRFQLAPREHTKLILPMSAEVLDEAGMTLNDVDAIAFGRGPGAFTGLRIAAGVAQGLALSVDIPVVPVSTLAALALQASEQKAHHQLILAALDARMDEVYWGTFSQQLLQGEERVSPANTMLEAIHDNYSDTLITGIGSGWDVYQDQLDLNSDIQVINHAFPSAEQIAKLALDKFKRGESVDAAEAQPVYIRDNVAEKTKKNS